MSEAEDSAEFAFVEPVNTEPPDESGLQLSFLNSISLTQMNQGAFVNEVKATENGISAMVTLEALGLVTLIQTLHSANSNLLNRANQVEEALTECQKSLQSHQKQLHSAELITQQSQELASAQERVRCLSQDLEAYHRKLQHQRILAESLIAQLQSSQERVVQLERESACTQSKYDQQSHQLMQTENVCRELQARLTRQQSYTLQLKLALEGSPDAPVFTRQAQPIQSWSAQPQTLTDELELDENSHPSLRLSPETDFVEELHLQTSEPVAMDLSAATVTEAGVQGNPGSVVQSDAPEFMHSIPQVQLLLPESLQQETDLSMLDTNWPSPVVYPSRPPLGRKSLAAIELPTFA